MCDPATGVAIAGIAISAAGAVAQQRQQNNAIDAQNEQKKQATARSVAAANEERGRQQGLEQQAFEEVANSLRASNEVANESKGNEVRDNLVEQSAQAAPNLTVSALPGQVSGDTDLSRLIGGEIAGATGKAQDRIKALATLTGLGSAFSGLQDQLGDSASGIANVNSKRRGSAGAASIATATRPGSVSPSGSLLPDLAVLGGQGVSQFGGDLFGTKGLSLSERAANSASRSPIFAPTPVARPTF